ncbi:LUD domain-containing protein [Halorarum salinum]|uniref:LUD domain-containing protein n=1 Tax=Halorarum salinum TaxID=2743089 RepID=A0A7D5LBD6_9EURY|nr:LUD domain-containing protein [Halobaculum salinum]
MTRRTTAAFEASLDGLDVGRTRTTPGGFEAVLREVVRQPAVGVPLPDEGLSLPASVTTDATPAELADAATGVTAAALGIADYGSVVLPSTATGAEQVSLFPPLHVAVLRESDVVAGMPEAIERLAPLLRDDRGSAVVATGPSATADMGDLVRGAHGPEEVHVVIVEDDEGTRNGTVDSAGDETSDAGEGGTTGSVDAGPAGDGDE